MNTLSRIASTTPTPKPTPSPIAIVGIPPLRGEAVMFSAVAGAVRFAGYGIEPTSCAIGNVNILDGVVQQSSAPLWQQ